MVLQSKKKQLCFKEITSGGSRRNNKKGVDTSLLLTQLCLSDTNPHNNQPSKRNLRLLLDTMTESKHTTRPQQRRRFMGKDVIFVVTVIFQFLMVMPMVVEASDSSSPPSQPSFRLVLSQPSSQQRQEQTKPRKPLSSDYPKTVRVLRSWMIRHNSNSMQQRTLQDYNASNKRDKSNKANANNFVGTRLSLKRPTLEQVSRWYNGRANGSNNNNFPSIEDNNIRHALRAALQSPFNHDSVGMTNPLLNVFTASSRSSSDEGSSSSSSPAGDAVILASTRTKKTPTSERTTNGAWWPSLDLIPNQRDANKDNVCKKGVMNPFGRRQRGNKNEWQVLKYRSYNIGTGRECYEKVRDAALDWTFATSLSSNCHEGDYDEDSTPENGDMGMFPLPDDGGQYSLLSWSFRSRRTSHQQPSPNSNNNGRVPSPRVRGPRYERVALPKDNNDGNNVGSGGDNNSIYSEHQSSYSDRVRPIWSGPGGRKFVTYGSTSNKLLGVVPVPSFLRIYAVNPVMSVYDLVDQRGPGTTYTSTAYATMKGHLLCGEERVTVAWRDDGSTVDVEVVSLSKPAPGLAAKLVWPFAKQMQPKFFQSQLKALQNVAAKHTTTAENRTAGSTIFPNYYPDLINNGQTINLSGITTSITATSPASTIHTTSLPSSPWRNAFSRKT